MHSIFRCLWARRGAALLTGVAAVVAMGCTPGAASEPGWRTVEARQGHFGHELPFADVNFTMEVPQGWQAVESFPEDETVLGTVFGPDGQTIEYSLRAELPADVWHGPSLPPENVLEEEIDGVKVTVEYPFRDRSNLVTAEYERIPGGPQGAEGPALILHGFPGEHEHMPTIEKIIRSVRYKPMERPETPRPQAKSGPDWVRVNTRQDPGNFTVLLPPGWEIESYASYDFAGGVFEGDGLRILYQYGSGAGEIRPGYYERDPAKYAPHFFWEERIDGETFWFHRPTSDRPDSLTGAWVNRVPRGDDGEWESLLSVWAEGNLAPEQQETVLAIIRTIRDAETAD